MYDMSRSTRPPSLMALPSYLASYVARYGRQLLQDDLDDRALHLVHNAVLTALNDFGPLSQQQLADALRMDKSHLVRHIDLLEERGYIRRAPDADDRRRYRVTLTGSGVALVTELGTIARRSQQQFLGTLNADEQDTLITLLHRVLVANDAEPQER
ncbi:MarR family transcriptional regulator [soil metagenome]